MRWIKKTPKTGYVRVIKKFLFLPLTLNNETRWLEFATIMQVYVTHYYMDSEWVSKEFID